jgi:hypothetical protein
MWQYTLEFRTADQVDAYTYDNAQYQELEETNGGIAIPIVVPPDAIHPMGSQNADNEYEYGM